MRDAQFHGKFTGPTDVISSCYAEMTRSCLLEIIRKQAGWSSVVECKLVTHANYLLLKCDT